MLSYEDQQIHAVKSHLLSIVLLGLILPTKIRQFTDFTITVCRIAYFFSKNWRN